MDSSSSGLPSISVLVEEELEVSRTAFAHEHPPEERVDLAKVIGELKRHSAKIREAHETVGKSRVELKKHVDKLRVDVEKKEAELRLLNSWPLQIADDAKKWMELWESEFGKRVLNTQFSQLAENAIVVEQVGQTVDYCRRFIYAKRNSHEEWRKSSVLMRPFYASELKRVQEEIGGLRADVAKWEADVNRNEMSVAELGGRLQQLKLQLVEKRTQLDEAKADHRETVRHQRLAALHKRSK